MLASQNWVREKCIQQSAKLLEFDKLGDTSLTPSQVGDIQDNCLMSDIFAFQYTWETFNNSCGVLLNFCSFVQSGNFFNG